MQEITVNTLYIYIFTINIYVLLVNVNVYFALDSSVHMSMLHNNFCFEIHAVIKVVFNTAAETEVAINNSMEVKLLAAIYESKEQVENGPKSRELYTRIQLSARPLSKQSSKLTQ